MLPKARLAIPAAVCALAALLLLPASALAKPVQIKTFTSAKAKFISQTEARYSGDVSTEPAKPLGDNASKNAKKRERKAGLECLDGRVVSIYHRGVLIARTLTNDDGSWSVVGPAPPIGDEVEVAISKRRTGLAACRGRSLTITV